MALTINTHPDEVITNAPEFDVSTSLTEGASYQNLRIRATVHIGGQSGAVAVLEQPKGLDDWDFFALLKSFIGRCNVAINGSSLNIGPALGSELLSAWTDALSTFETFTTSGREITSAIDSNASGGLVLSNDFGAISAGEIFIVGLEEDFADSGTADEVLSLNGTNLSAPFSSTNYAGLSSGKLKPSHIYLFHATDDDTVSSITIGHGAGANGNFTGTFTVHKITDFRNNPGAYFHIKFEEVYENASDVTTIGAESWSDTMLFVPVVIRANDSFDNYILGDGDGDRFLSRLSSPDTFPNGLVETPVYRHDMFMEVRVMYISTATYIKAQAVVDAGTNEQTDIVNPGWGMLVMNDSGLTYDPTPDDTSIVFWLYNIESGGATVDSMFVPAYCDTGCHRFTKVGATNYPLIKALSFVGDLGEEMVLFRGEDSQEGITEKSFYKDVNRMRKVLKSYPLIRRKLMTRYENEGFRNLLHELISTDLPVFMQGFYEYFVDDSKIEVTVLTDEVLIRDGVDLFESEIDIEYYE